MTPAVIRELFEHLIEALLTCPLGPQAVLLYLLEGKLAFYDVILQLASHNTIAVDVDKRRLETV